MVFRIFTIFASALQWLSDSSAPDPAGGAYVASSDPISYLRGPSLRGRDRMGR